MIRLVTLLAVMVLGAVAYGASAVLTVNIVPPNGCLQGSYCPPGIWINDLDDHFATLSSNWVAGVNDQPGGGGIGNCQQPGAMVFNNPGITIYGLPQETSGPNAGVPNGCWFSTPFPNGWSTPGYFEASMMVDTATDTWTDFFFEFGPNNTCNLDIANGGVEPDLLETPWSPFNIHWAGYQLGCTQSVASPPGVTWGTRDGQFHVWGLDYGDNGAITFYRDGMQKWQWAPSDGVEPGSCPQGSVRCTNGNWLGQIILMDFIGIAGPCDGCTATNGTTIQWVRHYHR